MPREQDIDKLEQLPLRERNHDYSWENDDYWSKDFPYRRMRRWIESCKGRHIDEVISEYVHAKWVPKHHRFINQFRRHIELDTFIRDGAVHYYSRYMSIFRDKAPYTLCEDGISDCIYVHPTTRLVCVYKAPTRKSWRKEEQEKLAKRVRILGDYHQLYKMEGIWYEIKAKPLPTMPAMSIGLSVYHSMYKRCGPKDIIMEGVHDYHRKSKELHVKITLKRQLNGKELKKYGLTNDKK